MWELRGSRSFLRCEQIQHTLSRKPPSQTVSYLDICNPLMPDTSGTQDLLSLQSPHASVHTNCKLIRLSALALSQRLRCLHMHNSAKTITMLQGTSPLSKDPIDKLHKTGVLFLTYSLLIASLKKGNLHSVDEQNIVTNGGSDVLPTLASLGVNDNSRLAQIVKWLKGRDGRGECLIILDECHKAKNLIAKEGEHLCSCSLTCAAASNCNSASIPLPLESMISHMSLWVYTRSSHMASVAASMEIWYCRVNNTDWQSSGHPTGFVAKRKSLVQ